MSLISTEEHVRIFEQTKRKNHGIELLQHRDRTLNEWSNTVGKRMYTARLLSMKAVFGLSARIVLYYNDKGKITLD